MDPVTSLEAVGIALAPPFPTPEDGDEDVRRRIEQPRVLGGGRTTS